MMKGILMHISSLGSEYGIGSLGAEAFRFVDFLEKANQALWQILPQNPTGFGDSPYRSVSIFAGNPYFIDISELQKEGLLTAEECGNYYFGAGERVDYEKLFFYRFPLLRCAFFRFERNVQYRSFEEENAYWLDDYALFMTIKEQNHYVDRESFPDALKNRDNAELERIREKFSDTIDFYKFVQFKFFEQWDKVRKYANERGIKIIGDLPLYSASDSAEVWANAELFEANNEKALHDAELDGTAEYNWGKMKADGYAFLKKRFELAEKLYDIVRIDRFGDFFREYTHSDGGETAKKRVPGEDLFEKLMSEQKLGIIAEERGKMPKSAQRVIEKYGFYKSELYNFSISTLPSKSSIVYTSTHDTMPFFARGGENPRDLESAIKKSRHGAAVIVPIQDYLGEGAEGRMNTPGTVGGNWLYRVRSEALTNELSEYIKGVDL